MALSLPQVGVTPNVSVFAAASRGVAGLAVEPAQRVTPPAGSFDQTGGTGSETDEASSLGGDARAELIQVDIIGPRTGGRGGSETGPFSGGRPAVLVDQGGVSISQQADTGQISDTGEAPASVGQIDGEEGDDAEAAPPPDPGETSATGEQLTEEEQKVVDELKQRDAEVRRHEQAHAAVGGQYAGSPSYTYQQGPDGGRYAIGGEVSIDASPIEGDPEATILKLQQVRRAALAPAEPSSQDQSVAAAASAGIAQAQAELAAQRQAERQGTDEEGESSEIGDTEQASETETENAVEQPGPFSIASELSRDEEDDGAGFGAPDTGISPGIAGALSGAALSGVFGDSAPGQSRIISIAV